MAESGGRAALHELAAGPAVRQPPQVCMCVCRDSAGGERGASQRSLGRQKGRCGDLKGSGRGDRVHEAEKQGAQTTKAGKPDNRAT